MYRLTCPTVSQSGVCCEVVKKNIQTLHTNGNLAQTDRILNTRISTNCEESSWTLIVYFLHWLQVVFKYKRLK